MASGRRKSLRGRAPHPAVAARGRTHPKSVSRTLPWWSRSTFSGFKSLRGGRAETAGRGWKGKAARAPSRFARRGAPVPPPPPPHASPVDNVEPVQVLQRAHDLRRVEARARLGESALAAEVEKQLAARCGGRAGARSGGLGRGAGASRSSRRQHRARRPATRPSRLPPHRSSPAQNRAARRREGWQGGDTSMKAPSARHGVRGTLPPAAALSA